VSVAGSTLRTVITLHGTYEAVPPADYTGAGPRLELSDGQSSGETYDEAYGALRDATPEGFRLVTVRSGKPAGADSN
jgi:hypothetical protein